MDNNVITALVAAASSLLTVFVVTWSNDRNKSKEQKRSADLAAAESDIEKARKVCEEFVACVYTIIFNVNFPIDGAENFDLYKQLTVYYIRVELISSELGSAAKNIFELTTKMLPAGEKELDSFDFKSGLDKFVTSLNDYVERKRLTPFK